MFSTLVICIFGFAFGLNVVAAAILIFISLRWGSDPPATMRLLNQCALGIHHRSAQVILGPYELVKRLTVSNDQEQSTALTNEETKRIPMR
jgi:hypothetical protein